MTRSNVQLGGQELKLDADGDTSIQVSTDDTMVFDTAGSRRMSVESDGDVFIGKTTGGTANIGVEMRGDGLLISTRDDDVCSIFRRNTSDGEIARFQSGTTITGKIGSSGSDDLFILATSGAGMLLQGSAVLPANSSGASVDDDRDLGSSSKRWRDIYTNGAVTTSSDQNEKQDIANLSAKELKVANKLSALFKTYRWKDRVAEKGDKARTHSGIIAQDIQSAFSAEGLDASNYGMFISNTWWEKEVKVDAVKANEEKEIEAKDAYTYIDIKNEKTDGYTEKTRLAVRYTELFSFIFSSIEARLTALESK